jgi:hypothetical protein
VTRLARVPLRAAAGGYLLHTGIDHWKAHQKHAAAVHQMAATAFPLIERVPPQQFVKGLATAEIGIGAALVTPVVPPAIAGAALTSFALGLLGVYARVPGLRRPKSVLPTREGVAISKDVWLLAIALALVVDRG